MIKDKPNKFIIWLIRKIVVPYILRVYRKLSFIHEFDVKKEEAVLMLMNHFSFTDGPILHRVADHVLHKNYKVMIVEDQLKNFMLLRYIGCFSINKKSRTVVDSLNYAVQLLKDPDNMVGIYPQGQVYSMHLNRIHFEKGLEHILKKSTAIGYQIVFGVTLVDYLDGFKPHARVYTLPYEGKRELPEMEAAYNHFYQACKIKQQQMHQPPAEVIDSQS